MNWIHNFRKEAKWHTGKYNISKWFWSNWIDVYRRIQIDPYKTPCTKLNSKCTEDFNINPDILNQTKEKKQIVLNSIAQERCSEQNVTIIDQHLINGTLWNVEGSAWQRTLAVVQNGSFQNGKRFLPTTSLMFNKTDSEKTYNLIKTWGTDLDRKFSKKKRKPKWLKNLWNAQYF